jgi:hypothetical protein
MSEGDAVDMQGFRIDMVRPYRCRADETQDAVCYQRRIYTRDASYEQHVGIVYVGSRDLSAGHQTHHAEICKSFLYQWYILVGDDA